MKNNSILTFPNSLSVLALLSGLIGVVLLTKGLFFLSFGIVLVGFIFDLCDGYFARKFHQVSDFGARLDAFGDSVLYLIYPSCVFYSIFGLTDIISISIIWGFLFAGLFRLIRTYHVGFSENSMYYLGLPVVFSLLLIIVLYYFQIIGLLHFKFLAWGLIFLQSALMIMDFKFPKPKNIWPLVSFLSLLIGLFFTLAINGN